MADLHKALAVRSLLFSKHMQPVSSNWPQLQTWLYINNNFTNFAIIQKQSEKYPGFYERDTYRKSIDLKITFTLLITGFVKPGEDSAGDRQTGTF